MHMGFFGSNLERPDRDRNLYWKTAVFVATNMTVNFNSHLLTAQTIIVLKTVPVHTSSEDSLTQGAMLNIRTVHKNCTCSHAETGVRLCIQSKLKKVTRRNSKYKKVNDV